ncbi:MAG: MBL fold metallo-hydrolase [Bacteriovorax sp.]
MSKSKHHPLSIVTLGTKGNIKERRPFYSNHSGVLIGSSILLDLGEKKFLKQSPKAIFITHFHPDHACFMLQETGPIECPIFGPSSFLSPHVRALHRPIKIDAFKITPIPTVHSFKIPSQGYLVEGKGKRLFYTGDIISIEKKHLAKLKRVDVVITEASSFRRGGTIWKFGPNISGHNGVRELLELFRPFTNRIIFMHFGPWFVEDVREGKKKIIDLSDETLSVEVAHDGKEFLV